MKRRIAIGLGTIVTLGLVWWLVSVLVVSARSSKFDSDVSYLFSAFQEYKEHVGTFPIGSNAQIAKALKGENPKKVIIFVGRQIDMNEKGEFVDPWGTAFRIYFSHNDVMIRSAGPNKRFDDSGVQDSDDFFCSKTE